MKARPNGHDASANDVDGCTGVLVVHDDGTLACPEEGCADPDPCLHDWRAACADATGGCSDCTPGAHPLSSRRAA